MTIMQKVHEFAAKQNQASDAFLAAAPSSEAFAKEEEAEAGMAEMAAKYREGGDLYMPADN
jgi:phosphomethylpyrimidine synthase